MLCGRIVEYPDLQIRGANEQLVPPFGRYRQFVEKPEGLTTIARRVLTPRARLELASAAVRLGGGCNTELLVHELLRHKEDAADPAIPLMLWLAYEPRLAAKPQAELEWLQANAADNPLITDHIVSRAMRRLVATGKADDLNSCIAFVAAAKDAVRLKALEGLAEALKGRQVDAPSAWAALASSLDSDPATKALAQKLAVSFRDPAAGKRAMASFEGLERPTAERDFLVVAFFPVSWGIV